MPPHSIGSGARPLLRSLYDWVMEKAHHPKSLWALAGVCFAESSFFPIPPDVMLIPMVLADRTQAWRIAAICTIASVLGGLFGYAIGYLPLETVGQWVITLYGMQRASRASSGVQRMGPLDHPDQGPDPDPLQARHHRQRRRRISLLVFVLASIVTRGCASSWSRCCSISSASRSGPSSRDA